MTFPQRARVSAGACLLLVLGSCGEGGPANPQPLRFERESVSVLEVVEVGVAGVTVPSDGGVGTLGSQNITGFRVSDSTMSILIPEVAPGQHELRVSVGGRTFVKTLNVVALAPVTNSQALLDGMRQETNRRIDSLETVLVASGSSGSTDTTALRADIRRARDLRDSATKYLTSLSAADRAKVAAILVANGLTPDFSASSTPASFAALNNEFARCSSPDGRTFYNTFEECAADLTTYLQAVRLELAKNKIQAATGIALVAAGLSASSVGVGVIGVAAGFALLANVSPKLSAIGTHIWERITVPIMDQIAAPLSIANTTSFSAFPTTLVLGQPTPIIVTATYRSPTVADVSKKPMLGPVVIALNDVATTWNELADKLKLSLKAPTLPTTSLRTIIAEVPAKYLQLGALSHSDWSGTTSIVNGQFNVTLANAKQGKNHDVQIEVKHTTPETGSASQTFSATVKPAKYAIDAIALQVGSLQVYQGERVTIVATLRDSTGAILPASPQRAVQWSGNDALGTIHANGDREIALEGKAPGTVTVTATCEGKTAQVAITIKAATYLVATDAGVIVTTSQALDIGKQKSYKIVHSDGSAATHIDYSKVTLAGQAHSLGLVTLTMSSAGFSLTGAAEGNSTVDVVYNLVKVQTLTVNVAYLSGTPPVISGVTTSCPTGHTYLLQIPFSISAGPDFKPDGSYFGVYSASAYPVGLWFFTGGVWRHASNSYTARLASGTGKDGVIEISLPTGGPACAGSAYWNASSEWFSGWKVTITDRFGQDSNTINFNLTVWNHKDP